MLLPAPPSPLSRHHHQFVQFAQQALPQPPHTRSSPFGFVGTYMMYCLVHCLMYAPPTTFRSLQALWELT